MHPLHAFFSSLIPVSGLPPVYNNWYFIQYFYRGIFSKEHIMSAQHPTAARGIARAIRQLTVGYVRKRH
ncbi:type I toxin-antitoxin system SymE family toxin, partial [Klebsiella pneumoniae]